MKFHNFGQAVIFNLNDFVMLATTGQCLLLAAMLALIRDDARKSNQLLGAFLVIKAIESLDTLFIWSNQVREIILKLNPDIFFISFALNFLQGPLLYWYVSSVLYRDFRIRGTDCLHLIPVFIIETIVAWNYYCLPEPEQIQAMTNLSIIQSTTMSNITALWHLSVIGYGAWALIKITRYRDLLKLRYSNIELRTKRWLKGIVIGLVAIAGWRLATHFIGQQIGLAGADIWGVAGNNIELVFVTLLVFTSIRYVHLFDNVDNSIQKPITTRSYKEEHVSRISRLMDEQKPYLIHDITIEVLSKISSIPERALSQILNQHFEMNFFEFINGYRINEAKRLLSDPMCKGKTILELMNAAGFTSKSTFNTLFKKSVGETPSQFRQSVLHD
jgi:AraC-like DNA-binding protein